MSTSNATANTSDYSEIKNLKVQFKAFQTSQNITVDTVKDTANEDKESFNLNLYKSLAAANGGSSPVVKSTAYMKDAKAPSYDYSIISNHSVTISLQ